MGTGRVDAPKPPRKLGRGLSEVSHVFLSGAQRDDTAPLDGADAGLWMPDAHLMSVTSGVGVRGKSVVAANLGFGLSEQGRSVAFVNADSAKPGILEITGSASGTLRPPFKTANAAFGGIMCVDAQREAEAASPGHAVAASSLGSLETAARHAQVVVIDTSSHAESSITIWKLARLVMVLTEPSTDKMRASYATIKRACHVLHDGRIGLIVNMVTGHGEAEQCFRKLSSVCRRFLKVNLRNYGFIVHSDVVMEAYEAAVPLCRAYPDSEAAKCIGSILRLIVMDESAIAKRRREVTIRECALKGGQ